jgi:IS30 family transposase
MPQSKGKHLTKSNREVIEDGVYAGDSSRSIARKLDVSASTITREVKANRTIKEKKSQKDTKLSIRCLHYRDCQESGSACAKCSTSLTTCKSCRTRSCIESCKDYERRMCPQTESWPYVCPKECRKRPQCSFAKCAYRAYDAHNNYLLRLSASREGIGITQEELENMDKLVTPLIKQGQSFEAIWIEHAGELPVSVRSAYNYQEKELLSTLNLELPRKVRYKVRKNKGKSRRDRIDRTGRSYDDFKALALEEQVRVVQGDSVEGFEHNTQDLLSLHILSAAFQFYLLKKHADKTATVSLLDALERTLGSRIHFEAVFGILLVDRGIEFDDFEGMEQSCLEPNRKRCRVFYCDALQTNQKSEAERNHEQLRRILPKERSDFDKLSTWDVAVCTSHVNSYPSVGRGGKCPFELLGSLIPQRLFDELGIERVAPDDVILKPYLMKHAVIQ